MGKRPHITWHAGVRWRKRAPQPIGRGRIGRLVGAALDDALALGAVPDRDGAVHVRVPKHDMIAVCMPSAMGGWSVLTILYPEGDAGDEVASGVYE